MLTKAEIVSIDRTGNRCVVNMPLFQTAANSSAVTATALVSITPGQFNNLFVGDIVFIGFEENALEKPVILGKLYRGATHETDTNGGAGIFSSLQVNKSASIPASTTFEFPAETRNEYKDLKTPKKMADYIKQLANDFKAFRISSVQPQSLNIDDGDLDVDFYNKQE